MISPRLQRFIVSALLAVAVIAVYEPVTGYDFIALDDAGYVQKNPHVNHGFSWANIKWTFEHSVGGNWHPVTMLSHMTDCQIYGLYPGGPHFTNVLLHLANTLILFWLLLAITRRSEVGNQRSEIKKLKPHPHTPTFALQTRTSNLWPCALVAALFGLHPLHVESVAWISERKDVLSAFFFLLTLWAYFNYVTKRKNRNTRVPAAAQSQTTAHMVGWRAPFRKIQNMEIGPWYAITLAFFTLGLMSKPMVVTLPFVLLLLDYWPFERISNLKKLVPLLLEKIPFFALAAIFSVVTFFVQKSYGAVVQLEYFPLKARLANAVVCYTDYLGKMFWPHPLAMLYPYRHWTTAQIELSTILFVGLCLVAIWTGRSRRYIFVGWFWFVGMLVPVIGLVQVGIQVTADRYTYLPSIGLFIVLAWWLTELATSRFRCVLFLSGATLAVAFLSILTVRQVHYWKNSETLFEHAVRVTGYNTTAHYILGAIFEERDETRKALSEFKLSLRDNPDNLKAHAGLGYIYCCQGKLDEAAQEYQDALRIEPDSAKAHFGLAEVLGKQDKDDEAIRQYDLALKSDPNLPDAHYQLAKVYYRKHDDTSTIAQLRQTVQLAPHWFLVLNNLAWMLATESDSKLRNGPQATQFAIRAVVAAGRNNPNALDTLAAAYAETGRFKDAAETAKRAVEIAGTIGQTNLAEEIQSRLKLYQLHRAYREPAAAVTSAPR